MKRIVLSVCAAVAAAVVAQGETYTWTGGTGVWNASSGDSWTASDQSTGTVPGENDEAIIPGAATEYTVTVSEPFAVGSLSVGANAKLCFSHREMNTVGGDVHVLAGGVITHTELSSTANAPKDEIYRVALEVGGAMTVDGAVDVIGKGYRAKHGPGVSGNYSAAHGGAIDLTYVDKCYGSLTCPTNCGSGSSRYVGGGSVRLDVAGSLTVNGSISAESLTTVGSQEYGAGSGGSIWITCDDLIGAGTLSVAADFAYYGQGGGGGRLAVHLTEATDFASWKGKMKAHGSPSRDSASSRSCGGAGTIYLQAFGETPETATVVLDNKGAFNQPTQTTGYTPLVAKYGADVIGNLIVTNYARVYFGEAGATTRIYGDIDTAGGTILEYASLVELAGDRTQTIRGAGAWSDLSCTVPGKTLKFGTGAGDALNFRSISDVTFTGADGANIVLTPAVPGETWKMTLPVDGVANIEYATVDHSDASGGIAILTKNSTNGGDNDNWMFPKPMSPGDPVVWTGDKDSDWNNMANWVDKYGEHRTPVPDDKVVISAGCERWPVIPSAYTYWGLDVKPGATLTIAGGPVAVTNELSVAGTLVFTGRQRLDISATNATFAGATLDPCEGIVRILDGVQVFDPADLRFYRVEVRRSGGLLALIHGFKAKSFDARTEDAATMTFAAGSIIEADSIVGVCTAAAEGRRLTLRSSVSGTAWTLKSPRNICMAGVSVSDSTASVASAVAGLSDDAGGNTKWSFGGDVRVWLGGSDNFSAAANWCPAGALTENTDVIILSSTKNPKVSANTSVRSLTIGGDYQAVQLNVSAELSVSQFAYVGAGSTVVMDKPVAVGTDCVMANGSKLTHTALPATANEPKDECYRLNLSVGGDMTISSDASIDVSVCGYAKKMGPGGIDGSLCGGTYGGRGRNGTKSCYGSIRRPINCGSGGYSYGGGGAVQLVVGGTLTVDGKILAESSTSTSNGTGAGGSIWLTVGALVGEGYISAMSANTTWPAGGGRISIVQTTAEALAFNIANIEVGAVANSTGSGTLYIENANDEADCGELIVDGRGKSPQYSCELGLNVSDAGVPFKKITLKNTGRMEISADTVVRTKDVEIPAGCTLEGTGFLEMTATTGEVSHITGPFTLGGVICTNAGASVEFAAGKTVTICDGGRLLFAGTREYPVGMWATDGAEWFLNVSENAKADITYASVSNCDARAGSSVTAVDSNDLGGNQKWSFITPIPVGEVIEWTGAVDSDWTTAGNWSRGRAPIETDDVRILDSAATNMPVLSLVNAVLSKLTVTNGTTLTLSGKTINVVDELNVSGTLVFTDRQLLEISAPNPTFADGTVVPAESTVRILDGVQTLDPGDCTFCRVEIPMSAGRTLALTDGLKARTFEVRATGDAALVFAAGKTVEADSIVCACPAAEGYLTLTSSQSGEEWFLKSSRNAYMTGVKVSDSTAVGAMALASLSVDADRNTNWSFEADVREWVGESDDFSAASNWSPAGELTENSDVFIPAGAKNPKVSAATRVRSITIGGDYRTVRLDVGAELSVSQFMYVGAGSTVVMDKPVTVGTDCVMAPGSKLTHTALPADANEPTDECYRLTLNVAGNMTIASNASIDVSACGYSKGMGPGGTSTYLCGGTYGGCGQDGSKSCYGSIRRPINCGSGGVTYPGGGIVRLVVGGTLTVDGEILAESSSSTSNGTGAGGSIWLTVGALVGEGYISAMSANTTWPAGGGRISIVQTSAEALSFNIANIEVGAVANSTGSGTLYIENANDEPDCGELIIDGRGKNPSYSCELGPNVSDAEMPFRKITLKNTGRLNILADTMVRTANLEYPAGCTLSCAGGLEIIARRDAVSRVSGNLSVRAFVCTNGVGTVEFAKGTRVTVAANGLLNLNGQADCGLRLKSSEDGQPWYLTVGAGSTIVAKCLDVSDSDASGGEEITTKRSVGKHARNSNWKFPGGMALIVR